VHDGYLFRYGGADHWGLHGWLFCIWNFFRWLPCKVGIGFGACEKTNLILNWEKCHLMVKKGIVLGHRISKKGIEVGKAKIKAIDKLLPPTIVKGVRSFLGHVGFYRRLIKDFSKISKPLCNMLLKGTKFQFDEEWKTTFMILKEKLMTTPIVTTLDWEKPFELMCDASDYAIRAVLGWWKKKTCFTPYTMPAKHSMMPSSIMP